MDNKQLMANALNAIIDAARDFNGQIMIMSKTDDGSVVLTPIKKVFASILEPIPPPAE